MSRPAIRPGSAYTPPVRMTGTRRRQVHGRIQPMPQDRPSLWGQWRAIADGRWREIAGGTALLCGLAVLVTLWAGMVP